MPSTVIKKFAYNSKKERLYVTFLSGKVYAYLNVPENVYEEMKEAFSKGKFLNENIKGKYAFKAV
ncbi:KTSC domain-containing protein [Chitinophaga sp. SYP-B3965]|nr:KTSC domain-containing protein [Chitinophaga sp. SYP-B3965]